MPRAAPARPKIDGEFDGDALELEARDACAARSGQLKSLTLLSGECISGASAAEAVCCLPPSTY